MMAAVDIARKTGAVVVPPYDDHRVVAGQATCGLEILQDAPDVSTVLVPVGGGGLSAGVAAIVKQLQPSARVIAVEPVGAATLTRALKNGGPTPLASVSSLADGLLPLAIGAVPFLHLQRFVDEVVLVEDADIAEAMRVIFDEFHLVAEPSGAAGFATLLSGRVTATGNVVAVPSGGNISAQDLAGILAVPPGRQSSP